ncbi:MAG TPA: ABC transporter permease [Gammaproteobacteria bacterium]|jgi:putative ABC transport system permease protein|nr:ABC transporter permease [Gammaproteobacteria bacterium]
MQTLKMALRNLHSTTFRTILAMLGILVGTASVVAMVSSGQMATEAALAQFKTLGTNLLAVNINLKQGAKDTYTLENALSLQHATKEIELLAPYTNFFAELSYRGQQVESTILGVTESLQAIVHINMLAGRFISALDKYEQYCVLGYDVFKQFNVPAEQVIGSRITMGNYRFVIIGVAEKWPENAFFNQNINTSILVPILTSQFFGESGSINNAIIRLKPDVTDLSTVKKNIENFIKNTSPNFTVFFRSAEELIKSMSAQHTIFILLLGLIGGISLFVGGIGVMNIMLVSVLERRREIGIRLAIGAHRSDIQKMFLAEAVFLSIMGGMLGIVVGILFSFIVAEVAHWKFEVFIIPPVVGFTSSVLVGIFFGFYPAYQASKLDPIQSLRTE